jgi:hypothetical protein
LLLKIYFDSNILFLYFLEFSFLLTFLICPYMLSAFLTTYFNTLIILILNFVLDNSKIGVIYESTSDAWFVSSLCYFIVSLLACLFLRWGSHYVAKHSSLGLCFWGVGETRLIILCFHKGKGAFLRTCDWIGHDSVHLGRVATVGL